MSNNPKKAYMDNLVRNTPDQIPQDRLDALLKHGSAQVMMDGNCGCCLLGPDLQEGEATFVCVDDAGLDQPRPDRWAMAQALNRMRARCGGQSIPYRFTC